MPHSIMTRDDICESVDTTMAYSTFYQSLSRRTAVSATARMIIALVNSVTCQKNTERMESIYRNA